jgi:hypothetical protein
MHVSAGTQKLSFEGMYIKVDLPAVLSFECDNQILALSNEVRIRVVATKSGLAKNGESSTSSTLFSIEPNGNIRLASNISKKLGLDLDENGSLKVLPAPEEQDDIEDETTISSIRIWAHSRGIVNPEEK